MNNDSIIREFVKIQNWSIRSDIINIIQSISIIGIVAYLVFK